MRLAVLGAGNAGQAMAADLTLKGFDVSLYDRSANRIRPIKEEGGIEVIGALEGFAELKKVTTDIRDAIQDADIISVAVPAFAHVPIMQSCASYLKKDQIAIFSSYYGALHTVAELRRKSAGAQKKMTMAETSTLIYACRLVGPARVKIFRIKKRLPVAIFPSQKKVRTLEILNEVYPQLVPAANILETSINNTNPIIHVPLMILNAGWIESTKGNFLFYRDGTTPSVERVSEELDKERLDIARALMLEQTSKEALSRMYYPEEQLSIGDIEAPSTMQARYLNEDVPYGLVPLASFGKMFGADTPVINSMITIASIINSIDYWHHGLTTDKLMLSGLDVRTIKKYVTRGEL